MSPDVSPDVPPADVPDQPVSTFAFDRLMVRKAVFEERERAPVEPDEKRPTPVNAAMAITVTVEEDEPQARARVSLAVVITPDMKWQPYHIEVVITGVFRETHGDAALLGEFCRRGVPAILFPYVRQIVSALTADAAYGHVRINPVNLQQLTVAEPTASNGE